MVKQAYEASDVLVDPETIDGFEALDQKSKDRLRSMYKAAVECDKKCEWHMFRIPCKGNKPFVVQGTKHRFLGMKGSGKKKFPVIRAFIPGKSAEVTRCEKHLLPEVHKDYGMRPVRDKRFLFDWDAVECKIKYGIIPPKSLTRMQKMLIKMGIGKPLGTPDLDNMDKVYLDFAKNWLFGDDALVYVRDSSKEYSDSAWVEIWIRERVRHLPTKVKNKK